MVAAPVTAASVRPVRRWSENSLRRYDTWLENDSGSSEISERWVSLKEPGSANCSTRSRAVTE